MIDFKLFLIPILFFIESTMYSQPGRINGNPKCNYITIDIDSTIDRSKLKVLLNGKIFDLIDTTYNESVYSVSAGKTCNLNVKLKDSINKIRIYLCKNKIYDIEIIDTFYNVRRRCNNYGFTFSDDLVLIGKTIQLYLPINCNSDYNKNDDVIHFCRIDREEIKFYGKIFYNSVKRKKSLSKQIIK